MVAILSAGIECQVSLKSPNAVGTVAVSVSGNTAAFTLTIDPAGVYVVRAWLADDTSGELSDTMPDASGIKDWGDVLTDANGQRTFTVTHAGAHSWYFCWAVIARRNINPTVTEFT